MTNKGKVWNVEIMFMCHDYAGFSTRFNDQCEDIIEGFRQEIADFFKDTPYNIAATEPHEVFGGVDRDLSKAFVSLLKHHGIDYTGVLTLEGFSLLGIIMDGVFHNFFTEESLPFSPAFQRDLLRTVRRIITKRYGQYYDGMKKELPRLLDELNRFRKNHSEFTDVVCFEIGFDEYGDNGYFWESKNITEFLRQEKERKAKESLPCPAATGAGAMN